MTDKGLKEAASTIAMALVLNGCLQVSPVDERALADGMKEAACYASGRDWVSGQCGGDK